MEHRMAYLRTTQDWKNRPGTRTARWRGLLPILTAMAAATILLLGWLLPAALVLPVISAASLAAAGAAALVAWSGRARRDGDGITLWDIAGVLAFIGFAAGMLSEPMHVAQLFGYATTAQ
jgi:hypothetical protein